METTGYIHSIDSFGSVDGPGVRFVTFLQGCHMRCRYCHNPDTWDMKKGTLYTTDELLEKAMKYRSYWKNDGGITVSGGEPLLQIDFLTAAQGAEKTVSLNGKSINVKIPAGTQNGQTLRLKGLGQPSLSGGEAGDVLITMNVGGHPYFSADGLNILLELPITMKEAVLGAKVTIPTISGKVAVNVPPYSTSGEKLRLKGKGIKSKSGQGDEIVTLKIVAPKIKNAELEKALAGLPDENVRTF